MSFLGAGPRTEAECTKGKKKACLEEISRGEVGDTGSVVKALKVGEVDNHNTNRFAESD